MSAKHLDFRFKPCIIKQILGKPVPERLDRKQERTVTQVRHPFAFVERKTVHNEERKGSLVTGTAHVAMKRIGWMKKKTGPWLCLILLSIMIPVAGSGTLLAQEDASRTNSFQPGVLELAGSTSFSVNYKNESGSGIETTHLRITPAVGYFVMERFEVLLQASYILDNIHESAGNNFRSHDLLLALGAAYNFTQFNEVLVPYTGLLLGMYYQKVSPENAGAGFSSSDLQLALGMEAGMRWMVTENLGLKAGFQYIHGFAEEYIGSTDFFGLQLGLSLFIPTWPSY